MATADALIKMTTQCCSAATDDGIEHLAMRPCKVRSVLLPKTVARCANDVGHLEWLTICRTTGKLIAT